MPEKVRSISTFNENMKTNIVNDIAGNKVIAKVIEKKVHLPITTNTG